MARRRPEERWGPRKPNSSYMENVMGAQGYMFNLSPRPWNPHADVFESEEGLVIKIEAPGVRSEDLEIVIEDRLLIIRGRRRREACEKGLTYQLVEIPYGPFERVFEIPPHVSLGDIRAEYREGFIKVWVPKAALVARLVPISTDEENE